MLKLNQGQIECYPMSHLCNFTLPDIFISRVDEICFEPPLSVMSHVSVGFG